MTEYATVSEVLKAFELILPMILFSLVVSILVVYKWIISFALNLLDFIEDMRERNAKHDAHVRVYYKSKLLSSPKIYICMTVIFTIFVFTLYMVIITFKSF